MKDVCALCGKELSGYYSVDYNNKQYKVCEDCYPKLKKGQISFDDQQLDMSNNIIGSIKKEENRIERKIIAQKDNPLYEDIHKIAGDIRFIKNIIIIGLIISIISGILSVVVFWILIHISHPFYDFYVWV